MVVFSLLYHINNSVHPLSHFLSSHPQSHEKRPPGLNFLRLDSHYNPSLQPDSPTLRLSLNSASAPTIPDDTFAWKCTASDERGILRHKNWQQRCRIEGVNFEVCQLRFCVKRYRWKWIRIWKIIWTKNLNMMRNCEWFERRIWWKWIWFDLCEFWLCLKWYRWKCISRWKTIWTKNLNVMRNCDVRFVAKRSNQLRARWIQNEIWPNHKMWIVWLDWNYNIWKKWKSITIDKFKFEAKKRSRRLAAKSLKSRR
jgi:hypothetical protein